MGRAKKNRANIKYFIEIGFACQRLCYDHREDYESAHAVDFQSLELNQLPQYDEAFLEVTFRQTNHRRL